MNYLRTTYKYNDVQPGYILAEWDYTLEKHDQVRRHRVMRFFTAYIAKRIMAPPPVSQLDPQDPSLIPSKKSAGRISKSEDPPYVPANLPAERPTGGLDAKHMSYASQSTTGAS
ncbi:hypothetical protein RhiLY_09518 [Ceratobasidium sp. AG-Ba]|nr:hypothetical protein RhiLY_09518 [Ceratobasidium sp. AG-Ba]